MKPNKPTSLWIVLAALAFYAVFLWRTSFTLDGTRYFVLFEDAMISMRYASHLAAGQGLTWNVGEPPIEGFTNLLWVLWMSVAHLVQMSESKISLFIMLTGVAVMFGNGLVVSRLARHLSPSAWLPLFALAAMLFDYPVVFWTLRGMEVGTLSLLLYTLVWLTFENEEHFAFGRVLAMGFVAALALLLRSDAAVPIGLIGLYGLLTTKKRVPFALGMAIFPVLALGGQMISRRQYFHDSLPNTYYLKLYQIKFEHRIKRGLFVALDVLSNHLAFPLSCVLASFGARLDKTMLRDKQGRRIVLFALLFTAQVAYATYVGGDAWEWMLYANRYLCVGMPALILLSGLALERVLQLNDAERADWFRRFGNWLVVWGALLLALNVFAKLRPEEGIAATLVFSKTMFAVGGSLVFVGLLLRLRDLRLGFREALAYFTRRAAQRHYAFVALGFALFAWLPAHALPLGRWLAQNAAQYSDEARYTRLGLLIRATTPTTTRIAVAAAGATPYFSARPTEDLLGKNDSTIAHLAPRGVFSPGHDKWDYSYSLGQKKSELIVELVDRNEKDEQYIKSLGFVELPNELRVRDTLDVDQTKLGAIVNDAPALSQVLASAHYTLPDAIGAPDLVVIALFFALIAFVVRASIRSNAPPDAATAPYEPEPGLSSDQQDLHDRAVAGAAAKQIPPLDGLRGIAVISVLVFHFAWTFPEDSFAARRVHEFYWSGWTGVDLFFVLSGFLITRGLVVDSKRSLGTRMKMFWMRRVLRIFPLYYAFVIVGSIVALALGLGWIPTWHYWLYMQNYALAFDPERLRWTAHFWSLAIEEQFYFIWPIVALSIANKRLAWVTLVAIGVCVALRAVLTFKLHLEGEDQPMKFVYRATFTRADGLLLGALAAVVQREVTHPLAMIWRRLRYPVFVATGVALLGLYAACKGLQDYDRRMIVVGYVTLAAFFATAVSLCGDGLMSPRVRAILCSRPLVACGKVSYGMYIFHWVLVVYLVPRLTVMQATMSQGTQMALVTGVIVGGIALVYVVATLSFRFFETPFLKLKGRFHD